MPINRHTATCAARTPKLASTQLYCSISTNCPKRPILVVFWGIISGRSCNERASKEELMRGIARGIVTVCRVSSSEGKFRCWSSSVMISEPEQWSIGFFIYSPLLSGRRPKPQIMRTSCGCWENTGCVGTQTFSLHGLSRKEMNIPSSGE